MTKRLHLNEALQKAGTQRLTEEIVKPGYRPISRAGKKVIAGHFDKDVVKQLKQIALNKDQSLQAILAEALNDLFEKYSFKPIALSYLLIHGIPFWMPFFFYGYI